MTVPPVSTFTGRRQGLFLRGVTIATLVMAGVGVLGGAVPFAIAGVAALYIIGTTPIFRVLWLVFRWSREPDWPFLLIAVALLAVIGAGGFVAYMG